MNVIILSISKIDVDLPKGMFSLFDMKYAVESSPSFPGVKIPNDQPSIAGLNILENLIVLIELRRIFRFNAPIKWSKIIKGIDNNEKIFISIKDWYILTGPIFITSIEKMDILTISFIKKSSFWFIFFSYLQRIQTRLLEFRLVLIISLRIAILDDLVFLLLNVSK